MGTYYVNSGASGSNNGSSKTNAFTTLAAAIAASDAGGGNLFYIAHTHVEGKTGADLELNWKANIGTLPDRAISVNFSGSTPPAPADYVPGGARINVTGNYNLKACTALTHIALYGLAFEVASGAALDYREIQFNNNYDTYDIHLEDCVFRNKATSRAIIVRLGVGYPWGPVTLVRPKFYFTGGNDGLVIGSRFRMRADGQSLMDTGATQFANSIFASSAGMTGAMELVGLDLSDMPAGQAIGYGAIANADYILKGCKLGSNQPLVARSVYRSMDAKLDAINCHTAGNQVISSRDWWNGILTTETTIKRTAGATDGTTAHSYKVVMNNSFVLNNERPFETFEASEWISSVGSPITRTAHILVNNFTPTDNEIWLEVEYFGDSGSPKLHRATSRMANPVLSTPANLTSDSGEAWSTGALPIPQKFKMSVTFTPQLAGLVSYRVCIARKNCTVYVCPKVD